MLDLISLAVAEHSVTACSPIEPVLLHNDNTFCKIICADSRKALLDFTGQVDLMMTSPPYADARKNHYDSVKPSDYPDWFATFHEAFWQTLKPTGSLVINIKDKVVGGVRHRYVWHTLEKLTRLGWYCIDDYIWVKKNAMPGRWPNRLKDGWEYVYHLAKTKRPYFNADAVRRLMKENTKLKLQHIKSTDNKRMYSATGSGFSRNMSNWLKRDTALPSNVLYLAPEARNQGHPAVYPVELPSFFIKLLTPAGGLVVDPFSGSGTTGVAAISLGRQCILIDNKLDYCSIAEQRLKKELK